MDLAKIYQGQFGEFTITDRDRLEVITYRGALLFAAICFTMGTIAIITQTFLNFIPWLYLGFSAGLGIALVKIHVYLQVLHRALQIFWAIGTVSTVICAAIALQTPELISVYIYQHPFTILGIGFTFVALTGIFFKEAFCFNRLETKLLVAIAPTLLLGHLLSWLTVDAEKILLVVWAILFMIFATRKLFQDIPADIGDKSVFAYLEQASANKSHAA